MPRTLDPFRFLLITVAGWLGQQQRDAIDYLLPECTNQQEVRERLEEVCGQVFEEQLDGWYRVPSSWPSRRNFDAFDRWFEWSLDSVVVELSDDPLLREGL